MDVNNDLYSYEPGFRSRNYNENNFYFLLKHKQQYFRNSFFVRSASLWNSLPGLSTLNIAILADFLNNLILA
jgi:hypothetical protein